MPIIKWPVKICYKLKGIKNREVDSDIKEVPRASLVAQLVKNPHAGRRRQFYSWVGEIRCRRDRLPAPVLLGFPCGSAGKESAYNA